MRKVHLATFIAVIFVTMVCAKSAVALHVMIDPGHGGADHGASRGTLKESAIALRVSENLAEYLKQDSRFKVSLTRTSDQRLSLESRTQMALDSRADVFVSIHLNSSRDSRARGKEIYFQNQLPADEEATFLASRENESEETNAPATSSPKPEALSSKTDLKLILEDLHRNQRIVSSSHLSRILVENWSRVARVETSAGHRPIRQAPFKVVTDIHIPSVLIELGFLSHPVEGVLLSKAEYQQELARGIYNGLVKYKETVDKNRRENLKSQLTKP